MININKIPSEYGINGFEDDNLNYDSDENLIPNKLITPKFDKQSLYYLKMSYTICYNKQTQFVFTAVIDINTNVMTIHPLVPRRNFIENLKDYDDKLDPITHYNPKMKYPDNSSYLGPVLGSYLQNFNKHHGAASSHLQITRLAIYNHGKEQGGLLISGYIRTDLEKNNSNANYKNYVGIIMRYQYPLSPSPVTFEEAANFRGFTLYVNSLKDEDDYYGDDSDCEDINIEKNCDASTLEVNMAIYGNSRGLNALVPLLVEHKSDIDNVNVGTNSHILNEISSKLNKRNIELSEKDSEFLKKSIIDETKNLKRYKVKNLPFLFKIDMEKTGHDNKKFDELPQKKNFQIKIYI
ncbi:MAG: hypothetical protein GY821_10415 [Gammaproteobacteria bacterium]|nr:hypothetical protein [Gammaproteobacteria bacterium]